MFTPCCRASFRVRFLRPLRYPACTLHLASCSLYLVLFESFGFKFGNLDVDACQTCPASRRLPRLSFPAVRNRPTYIPTYRRFFPVQARTLCIQMSLLPTTHYRLLHCHIDTPLPRYPIALVTRPLPMFVHRCYSRITTLFRSPMLHDPCPLRQTD